MRLLPLVLALSTAPLSAQLCSIPNTVLYNGNILTGVGLQPNQQKDTPQRVEAIAILNGKIIIAGTNDAAKHCASKTTKLIDLHGVFAMPGFNDAHTHIASAGQQKLSVDLDNVPSLSTMELRIRDYAMELAPGTWVLGGGWDHTKWDTKTLPTRQDLDRVTGDHPAFLERTDGHIAIVNTAALKAAGITSTTPDPPGGKIDRDPQGIATGIIREAPALALIEAQVPKPDAATRRKALELAIADALAHGVTSVQDFSDWDDFLVLESMEREGKLPLRIAEWMAFDLPLDTLKSRRASHPTDDPLLHLTQLKAFMDGSLGSRTAALAAPYSDDPNNSGLPRYEQTKLNQMSAERAAAGFQLGFHAIGDRANTMALTAFEAADAKIKVRDQCRPAPAGTMCPAPFRPVRLSRFRIEHAQVLLPDDFERFHSSGIIASMQPSHLLTDMAWAPDRLGPDRVKYAYAWKSFIDHGVPLAFGTDYPVESINPFRGIYSAVTRMNEAGTQTFQPQEKLTLPQALYAYTQASAFAEFREKQKGILAPGYLADIVVLDRDITKATPQQLLHTQVLRTIVNGQTVYTAQ